MNSRINHLRRLLIVHSFIYYRLCTSVVSDDKWQSWAEELKVLQAEGTVTTGFYDRDFQDWDGTTGMHLSQDPWVHSIAQYVVWLHEKYT